MLYSGAQKFCTRMLDTHVGSVSPAILSFTTWIKYVLKPYEFPYTLVQKSECLGSKFTIFLNKYLKLLFGLNALYSETQDPGHCGTKLSDQSIGTVYTFKYTKVLGRYSDLWEHKLSNKVQATSILYTTQIVAWESKRCMVSSESSNKTTWTVSSHISH